MKIQCINRIDATLVKPVVVEVDKGPASLLFDVNTDVVTIGMNTRQFSMLMAFLKLKYEVNQERTEIEVIITQLFPSIYMALDVIVVYREARNELENVELLKAALPVRVVENNPNPDSPSISTRTYVYALINWIAIMEIHPKFLGIFGIETKIFVSNEAASEVNSLSAKGFGSIFDSYRS